MDPFLQFLKTELPNGETIGEDVTVNTKTEGEPDEDNQPTYTETSHTLFAQIDILKATDRTFEGLKLQPGDAMGYFQKKDVAYLTEESTVEVTRSGVTLQFIIQKVTPEMVNIPVQLKQV